MGGAPSAPFSLALGLALYAPGFLHVTVAFVFALRTSSKA